MVPIKQRDIITTPLRVVVPKHSPPDRPGFTDRLYRLQPLQATTNRLYRPMKITGKRFKQNIWTISKFLETLISPYSILALKLFRFA